MRNKEKWNFWEFVSILILKNRIVLILLIVLLTIFLAGHWKNVKFTFTEANLLPIDHPENVKYSSFKNYFGEEGNIISIGLKDSVFFNEKIQKLWNNLNYELSEFKEIKSILSTNNLIELKKDSKNKKLIVNKISLLSKEKLLNELPFYENLIYDKTSESIRSILYMDKKIINTSLRKDFIFKKLIPLINDFEKKSNIDVRISGMQYVRTLNAQNIIDEI